MAIYHLDVRTGSRKGGQSALAKSDYICRTGKYRKHKDPVLFSTSGNMPEWADKPETFWAAADKYERANASLYREIEFALPIELTPDQRQALAVRFADEAAGKFGFPYTLAIHAGGGKNPHCHLVFSERMTDGIQRSESLFFARANKKHPEKGGCLKADISSKRKIWLKKTRLLWEEVCNADLEKYGHEARIDHRSYKEQGSEKKPTKHVGRRGTPHSRLVREHNAAVAQFNASVDEISAIKAEISQLPEPVPSIKREANNDKPKKKPKPKPKNELSPLLVEAHAKVMADFQGLMDASKHPNTFLPFERLQEIWSKAQIRAEAMIRKWQGLPTHTRPANQQSRDLEP